MKIDPANLDRVALSRLLSAVPVPRPVTLVSTVGEDGVFNVAPYSWVTPVIVQRPLFIVGAVTNRYGEERDTLINIRFSKDFVVSFVTEDLAESMIVTSTSYPIDVDEFKEAGLTPAKADLVKAPLVAESPVNIECKLERILEFGESVFKFSVIFGEVLRFHIKDEFYADGQILSATLKAIGTVGKDLYCRTTDIFEMKSRTTDNV